MLCSFVWAGSFCSLLLGLRGSCSSFGRCSSCLGWSGPPRSGGSGVGCSAQQLWPGRWTEVSWPTSSICLSLACGSLRLSARLALGSDRLGLLLPIARLLACRCPSPRSRWSLAAGRASVTPSCGLRPLLVHLGRAWPDRSSLAWRCCWSRPGGWNWTSVAFRCVGWGSCRWGGLLPLLRRFRRSRSEFPCGARVRTAWHGSLFSCPNHRLRWSNSGGGRNSTGRRWNTPVRRGPDG